MTLLTQQELADIKAKCMAATPGPWSSMRSGNQYTQVTSIEWRDSKYKTSGASIIEGLPRFWNPWSAADQTTSSMQETSRFSDADADFIAMARTKIPELLRHIDTVDQIDNECGREQTIEDGLYPQMFDVSEAEIQAASISIISKYGDVIGQKQAENIAYHALVAARGATMNQLRNRK